MCRLLGISIYVVGITEDVATEDLVEVFGKCNHLSSVAAITEVAKHFSLTQEEAKLALEHSGLKAGKFTSGQVCI